MSRQARRLAGARQRVPVVAYPAGVQHQREISVRTVRGCAFADGDKARLAAGGEELPVAEQAWRTVRLPRCHRPLHRAQVLVLAITERGQCADIEIALAVVFKSGQRRVFAPDVGTLPPGKGRLETHATGNFGDDPPVRPGLTQGGQKRALAGNAPLGVGHRALFLAPGLGG